MSIVKNYACEEETIPTFFRFVRIVQTGLMTCFCVMSFRIDREIWSALTQNWHSINHRTVNSHGSLPTPMLTAHGVPHPPFSTSWRKGKPRVRANENSSFPSLLSRASRWIFANIKNQKVEHPDLETTGAESSFALFRPLWLGLPLDWLSRCHDLSNPFASKQIYRFCGNRGHPNMWDQHERHDDEINGRMTSVVIVRRHCGFDTPRFANERSVRKWKLSEKK
jgi:hypothetical protein